MNTVYHKDAKDAKGFWRCKSIVNADIRRSQCLSWRALRLERSGRLYSLCGTWVHYEVMNMNRPSTISRTYPGTICRSYGAGREIYFLTGFTGFDRIILFFIFITFRTKVMKNNPPLAEVIQTFVCMSCADSSKEE
jgi:hypothetical protein